MENNNTNTNNINQTQTSLSFLDDKQSISFHIKDIVFLLLRNIHWLLIFAALGGLIAFCIVKFRKKDEDDDDPDVY